MRAALTTWLAMLLTVCPRAYADTGEPSSGTSGPPASVEETPAVHAQETETETETAGNTSAAPASAGTPPGEAQTREEAERKAQARELFEQGELLYRGGDFAGALRLWLQCYELATLPLERARALWIVAQAYRQSGECELARDKYREYAQMPAGEEARAEALSWADQLDTECPVTPPASLPQPQPVSQPSAPILATVTAVTPERASSPAEEPTSVRPWLAWSALGAGTVAAVASVGFVVASHRADSNFRELARQAPPTADVRSAISTEGGDPPLGDQLASVQHNGQSYNLIAWLLGGSAIVLAGTGATLLLLPEGDRPEPTSLRFSTGPNRALGFECVGDF